MVCKPYLKRRLKINEGSSWASGVLTGWLNFNEASRDQGVENFNFISISKHSHRLSFKEHELTAPNQKYTR